MQVELEATYKDGVLVPDRSLGADKEGKRFKLILVEQEEPSAKRAVFPTRQEHRLQAPQRLPPQSG